MSDFRLCGSHRDRIILQCRCSRGVLAWNRVVDTCASRGAPSLRDVVTTRMRRGRTAISRVSDVSNPRVMTDPSLLWAVWGKLCTVATISYPVYDESIRSIDDTRDPTRCWGLTTTVSCAEAFWHR